MLVEDCGSDTAVVSSLARIQTGGMWFVPEKREGNSCAISLGLFMSVSQPVRGHIVGRDENRSRLLRDAGGVGRNQYSARRSCPDLALRIY